MYAHTDSGVRRVAKQVRASLFFSDKIANKSQKQPNAKRGVPRENFIKVSSSPLPNWT